MRRLGKNRTEGLIITEASALQEPVTLTPAVRYDLARIFFALEAQHTTKTTETDDSPQEAIARIFADDLDNTPQPLPKIVRNGHGHDELPIVTHMKTRLEAKLATVTAELVIPRAIQLEPIGIEMCVAHIPGQPLH